MAEDAVKASSIHEAAREGDVEAVRRHLTADPEARYRRDRLSRTPLHLAAWAGQAEVVTLLCEIGADVGASALDDMASLHFACQKGHTEVVRILLAAGAYVNARNRKGMTALHFAVQGKREELTKVLIRKGANLSTENKAGKTPIDLAGNDSFKTLIREAEKERNARRAKNKENEKLSSGKEEGTGLERQGQEAKEIGPITVPERPVERQSQAEKEAEVVGLITVAEKPTELEIKGEEEVDVVGLITVPERPGTVLETQVEEDVNGKSSSGNTVKAIGVELATERESYQSIEPKRKKTKVSLLSFGDENEDEME